MSRIKINSGLASLVLLASVFSGWQTMLLTIILLFAFFDVDETVKKVLVSVITFYVGYQIVAIGWDIIVSVVNAILNGLTGLVGVFNNYVDAIDQISIVKLTSPVAYVIETLDDIVSIMLVLAKVGFVISTITGKAGKTNMVTSKIQEYVNKALNYVNNFVNSQQVNTQPQSDMNPTNVQ